MIPVRLRAPLLACGASLILLLGFPDSQGLWPLRLIADWPGEIGRAFGSLLFAGHLGTLALSQATQVVGATPQARGVGVIFQLATGLAFFWLAERPKAARITLIVLAGCAGIAAILPPVSAVTAAELGATLALAILASWKNDSAAPLGLQFLGGAMVMTPLVDLHLAG